MKEIRRYKPACKGAVKINKIKPTKIARILEYPDLNIGVNFLETHCFGCFPCARKKMVLLRQQNSGQQMNFLLLQPKILLQQTNVLLIELNILLL